MKKLYFSYAMVMIITVANAQITFQNAYGGSGEDHAFEVLKTEDGYAIGGFTNSFGAGNKDFYLVKTDELGNVQWSKTYGGSNNDECYGMISTADGGFVMAGYTNSFGSFGTDVFVIKINADGIIQWSKMVSNFKNDFVITVTGNTGFVIVGTTFSFGSGSSDMYLCKLDTSGNLLWSKAIGGSGYEWGYYCHETADGGVIATGVTNSFGGGADDIFLVKLSANGELQWKKTYGGSNDDDSHHAEQMADGNYMLTGFTKSFGAGAADFYLIKTDIDGNLLWSKTYGGVNNDYAVSVKPTSNGGFIINGYTESFGAGGTDALLVKIDSVGNVEWARTIGGSGNEYSNKLITTPDNGYAIAARTQSFGSGNVDFYLLKTDASGNTGCNESTVTNLISQSPVTNESTGGTVVNATPTVTNPTPTTTSPNTVRTNLCSACQDTISAKISLNNFNGCYGLYFSEYIEGSGKNRAIEIFNSSEKGCKNLDNYSIKIFQNASATNSTVVTLSGILPAKQAYGCCHDQSSTVIKNRSKMECSCIDFDGNDAIGLYLNDTLIDMIGQIGNTPGTNGWQVGTGFTKDNTLIRKREIRSGTPYWNVAQMEYNVKAMDFSDSLGKHEGICALPSVFFSYNQSTFNEGDSGAVAVQISAPAESGVTAWIGECFEGSGSYNPGGGWWPFDPAASCPSDIVISSCCSSGGNYWSYSCLPTSHDFPANYTGIVELHLYIKPDNDDDSNENYCIEITSVLGPGNIGNTNKHRININNIYPALSNNEKNITDEINIFPTVTSENIRISSKSSQIIFSNVNIKNVIGETVLNENVGQSDFELDLSNLSSGIYFVSVYSLDKRFTRKIIKL